MADVSVRRLHTRERLMAAAAELFVERSVQAASVEEICERAGFTRGAFYSNFESKDELCLALARQRGEQLVQITQEAVRMVADRQLDESAVSEILTKVMAILAAGLELDDDWVVVRSELRLYAVRNATFRPAFTELESAAFDLAARELETMLERQGATLRIPLNQLLITLDAYFVRTRLDEILDGGSDPSKSWRTGLEQLLRALIEYPEPDSAR